MFNRSAVVTLLCALGCSSTNSRAPAQFQAEQTFLVNAGAIDAAKACADFRKRLPVDIQQGFVKGPHSHQVFYYGRWKQSPLVIANGGPGMSSWSSYDEYKETLARENVEFLFFDQKGTGCSSPYPNLNDESLKLWSEFSSEGQARDIDLLRRSLQLGDRITVFGTSFGAKIALRYGILYPQFTRSILIHGDSFVPDEAAIVGELAAVLHKQKSFLERRFHENPQLENTLKSLERKFAKGPCARDADRLVEVCGYGLVRDLGHYYSDRLYDRIDTLLKGLDNEPTSAAAVQEMVNTFTRWRLSPQSLILGYLDYQSFIDDQMICDLAKAKVNMPSWYLNGCAITNRSFFMSLKTKLPRHLLTRAVMQKALKAHPQLRIYEFQNPNDLLNIEKQEKPLSRNWKFILIRSGDHFTFYRSPEFWQAIRRATADIN